MALSCKAFLFKKKMQVGFLSVIWGVIYVLGGWFGPHVVVEEYEAGTIRPK
jgi:hypothetical protein